MDGNTEFDFLSKATKRNYTRYADVHVLCLTQITKSNLVLFDRLISEGLRVWVAFKYSDIIDKQGNIHVCGSFVFSFVVFIFKQY